ncbi:MAG TPA: NHL repeat-containing protein, partial [Candidatus Saccharimonadales bacterium]|nr:NHL repeat-containing protein [Candidatus Saccharimonadales bacterium]
MRQKFLAFGVAFVIAAVTIALFNVPFFGKTLAVGSSGQNAENLIGQNNSDGTINYTSSTVNNPVNKGFTQPSDSAIDTINHLFYAVDQSNNRVLVFSLNSDNTFPDYNADYVVGQTSFSGTSPNQGGGSPTSTSLNGPQAAAIDSAGKLYVADTNNNRVLIYNKITSSNQAAVNAIGAADFTSTNSSKTVSNKRMISPVGIDITGTVDSNLKIFISDSDANRVLIFAQISGNDQTATNVLGQADFSSSSLNTNQTGFANPGGLASNSSGKLFVADKSNNRVMIWNNPTSNNQAADLVLGQTWFNANGSGTSATQFNQPIDITINADSTVFVSDSNNHRVLIFSSAITANGQAADKVLGQSNFTDNSSGISATKFNRPEGLSSFNGNNLYIADSNNNRIVAYNSSITSNGQAAGFVVGQSNSNGTVNFYGNAPNNPINRGLNAPSASSFDTINHRLYVADTGNNRVLIYNLNTDNTLPDNIADYVLGQQNFSITSPNRGNSANANTLNGPSDVFYDNVNQRLYVADTGNNRVLIWTTAITTNGQDASRVLGQATMSDTAPALGDNGLASPSAVTVNTTTNNVAVADRDNHRVLIWTSPIVSNDQSANHVLGQSAFDSGSYGLSDSTLHTPKGVAYDVNRNYLYVADSDNNRVLIWTLTINTDGQAANYVLGQSNFTSSGTAISP